MQDVEHLLAQQGLQGGLARQGEAVGGRGRPVAGGRVGEQTEEPGDGGVVQAGVELGDAAGRQGRVAHAAGEHADQGGAAVVGGLVGGEDEGRVGQEQGGGPAGAGLVTLHRGQGGGERVGLLAAEGGVAQREPVQSGGARGGRQPEAEQAGGPGDLRRRVRGGQGLQLCLPDALAGAEQQGEAAEGGAELPGLAAVEQAAGDPAAGQRAADRQPGEAAHSRSTSAGAVTLRWRPVLTLLSHMARRLSRSPAMSPAASWASPASRTESKRALSRIR